VTHLASISEYRTIWISDLHLGTRGCKAEFLLDFLRCTEAETIYLIMKNIGEGQVVSPRVHRPDLPPELEAIVLRAMMKAPADRFGSVHELGKALLSYATSRRRVIWAEYYGRGDGAASAPAGWAFPPTAPLPESAPRRRPPSFPPTGGSAEFAPEPVPKTSTVQHLRGSGRTKGWLLAGGFLAVVGGVVAMVVLRSPAEHRIIPVETVRPVSKSTVASTPILGEGSSESGRQALVREEVTISIADEPPRRIEVVVDATVETDVGLAMGYRCDDPKLIEGSMKTVGDHNVFVIKGAQAGKTLCRVGVDPLRPSVLFEVVISEKPAPAKPR